MPIELFGPVLFLVTALLGVLVLAVDQPPRRRRAPARRRVVRR